MDVTGEVVKTVADYEERITLGTIAEADELIQRHGLGEQADLMLRHTLEYADGSTETFEATTQESLAICRPLRELSGPTLQKIVRRAAEKYSQVHSDKT